MILHIPVISKQEGQVMVAARMETESPVHNLPADLWYRFPEKYESCLSIRADGFAATALLTAMYAGEDLSIRAPISPKLAYNLLEYRNIFHSWFPNIYRMIDIRYDKVEPALDDNKARGVGAAFSGGVDSFFTVWSHLAQNQPIAEARITHGLFMHGFDVRLDEETLFQALAKEYTELFNSFNLELILASSNAYQFAEFRIDWSLFFGAPLIGAALLLSPVLRRFHTPSGLSYNELAPQGSSALIDHLLSTEDRDIVHHGASTKRFEKIATLTEWSSTYQHLRVCANQHKKDDPTNCSHCHKCYLTMASLSILNSLPMYTTFNPNLTIGNYFHWGIHSHMNLALTRDIRKRAWKVGKIGIVVGLSIAILINIVLKMAIKFSKSLLSPNTLYQIKRKIYKPKLNEAGKNFDHSST
jgi:hypothetical protein